MSEAEKKKVEITGGSESAGKSTIDRVFGEFKTGGSEGDPSQSAAPTAPPEGSREGTRTKADIGLLKAANRQCYRELARLSDDMATLRTEIENNDRLCMKLIKRLRRTRAVVKAAIMALVIIAMNTPIFVFAVEANIRPCMIASIGVYAMVSLWLIFELNRLEKDEGKGK